MVSAIYVTNKTDMGHLGFCLYNPAKLSSLSCILYMSLIETYWLLRKLYVKQYDILWQVNILVKSNVHSKQESLILGCPALIIISYMVFWYEN